MCSGGAAAAENGEPVDAAAATTSAGTAAGSAQIGRAAAAPAPGLERSILQGMGDPVLLADAAGLVTWMNSAAELLSGWQMDRACGLPVTRVLPLVRESDGTAVESPVTVAARRREPVGLPNHTMLVRSDGSQLPVSCTASPLFDDAGEFCGAVLLLRNVERFRQAERAQAESELRLQVFADAIPTLAWVADADGWITWYNRRWYEYTGTTPAEMQGMGWHSVHHPSSLSDVIERWSSSVTSGAPFEMIFPLRGADGTYRSFLTRVTPAKDAAGKVLQWFGINLEINELEETRRSLAAERSRLAAILEHVPMGLVFADEKGRITGSNRRAESIFRHPVKMSGSVEEYGDWVSFHADGSKVYSREYPLAKTLSDGGVHSEEVLYQRGDGTLAWIQLTSAPLLDEDGRQTGGVVAALDIDARKRSTEELWLAQERTRILLQNARILLYTVDAERRYTWMHRPHPRVSMEELLGRTDEELEGSMQPLIDLKREAIASGASLRREVRINVRGADEVYDVTAEPMRDTAGRVTGLTVVAMDVTDRARIEQELREKSELIDLAESAIHVGYWSYYPATGECVLSRGEQYLFDLHSSNPAVEEVMERIYPEDRERVSEAMQEGMTSGLYLAEFRVPRKDGTMQWLAGQGRVLTDPDGNRYMVGINLDVTQRKSTEEALRRSEKLAVAGRLAASISHEINNPLESVTNLLYLIRSSATDEATLGYATSAEEELARVAEIVKHSLRFHRQSTKPTHERMSAVLDSAAGIYRSRLMSGGVEMVRDFGDTAEVFCYASELRQVFGNLIGNAFDAARQGGHIYLRTRDAAHPATGERGVRVTVADTGLGMNAQTVQRIAEPFFTTKGSNGTGLGLWISRDLLRKHRAHLQVRSRQRQPSGTVFSVFLPLDAVPSAGASALD